MIAKDNITISEIRTELGETSNDLGTLCQSPNINRWSLWKPTQINQFNAITEQQLKSINYGYGNMEFDNVYTAFEYVELNNNWSYIPPTNYFRMGDFRNYDQNAKPLYQMEIMNGATACAGENINFSFLDNIQQLRQWQIINNDLTLNVGMLLKKDSTIYYFNCGNIQDVDGEKLSLTIAADLPTGKYKVIPVFTNKNDVPVGNTIVIGKLDSGWRWIVLSTIPQEITVVDKPRFNPFDYITIDAPNPANFEYGEDNIGEYVQNINMAFVWSINADYPNKPMDVELKVVYLNALNDGVTQNITLHENNHTNCNANYMSEEAVNYMNKIYVPSIKDGELKLSLYMKIFIDNIIYEDNHYEFTLTQTNARSIGYKVIIRKI